MNPVKKWWCALSDRRQAGLRFVGVAALLVLTVLVSVSVISYVLEWRPDQSALASGENIRNAAASGGLPGGFKLRLQRCHLLRHVYDAPQEEELQARDRDFIGPGEGEESVFQKVVFRGGEP